MSLLKEIREQPQALANTLSRYLGPNRVLKMNLPPLEPRAVENVTRVCLIGGGSSYHAALIGRQIIEELALLPVSVEQPSEFRLRRSLLGPQTLTVLISSVGENPETLEVLRAAKSRKAPTLAVTNNSPSPLAEEADGCLTTLGGSAKIPFSIKIFSSQVMVLTLLAVKLAQLREQPREGWVTILDQLNGAPELLRHALSREDGPMSAAADLAEEPSLLILGRGSLRPVALEGALKLKEVAAFHAEGLASGEYRHGGESLLASGRPAVVLASKAKNEEHGSVFLRELLALGARVHLITEDGAFLDFKGLTAGFQTVPAAPAFLRPLTMVAPLQLLAYYIAERKSTIEPLQSDPAGVS